MPILANPFLDSAAPSSLAVDAAAVSLDPVTGETAAGNSACGDGAPATVLSTSSSGTLAQERPDTQSSMTEGGDPGTPAVTPPNTMTAGATDDISLSELVRRGFDAWQFMDDIEPIPLFLQR